MKKFMKKEVVGGAKGKLARKTVVVPIKKKK